MNRKVAGWAVLGLGCVLGGGARGALTTLTGAEERDIDARLARFAARPIVASAMDAQPAKFRVRDGRRIHPNPSLDAGAPVTSDPLLAHARAKATARYRDAQCRRFWRHFPGMRCGEKPDATAESDDQVADLAETWLERDAIAHSLDDLPRAGEAKGAYWSGDYWRMRWGLTSYRYADGVAYKEYEKAIGAYHQPDAWNALVAEIKGPEELAAEIGGWSPSEKYDLTIGASSFPLTNEQKEEGASFIGENGKIEDWYGLCDGWAPAAIFAPAATKPVTAIGAHGAKVTWYPHDIRAMVSLAWTNGDFWASQAGSRCDEEKPSRFPNGRLSQQECFDTNPATLHLALGNLLGKLGQPFVMDARFDAEVWNQPIVSYSLTYYDPLEPTKRGPDWRTLAVPYDDAFKAQDRFQKPLTRGTRSRDGWDDSHVKQVVGVIATVVYLTEVDAKPWPEPVENELVRVTYLYDLELHDENGKLVPRGGEWLSNVHPDFLWIPHKNSVALTGYDAQSPSGFTLEAEAPAELRSVGERAATRGGYPLCEVIKALLDASSGRPDAYRCR